MNQRTRHSEPGRQEAAPRGFRRAHAEAAHGDERVALLLRSFGQVHGYLDDASRFGALSFFDRALRNSGLRPVLLGTNMSVPPTHGVLLLQTADADWQAAFDRLAPARLSSS